MFGTHASFFNIITLIIKKVNAANEPKVSIKIVTFPEDPCTKNPITTVAIMIFAKSEQNLEIDSIWILFNFVCIQKDTSRVP